ncbi:unnamed protein product [Amoebophrya sp. A25]|nr:unnamed protein product [Amoebophrya sp. A25]|eukprot:GSA25T00006167001.1
MLGLRPPFGSASMPSNVRGATVDSNGFPTEQPHTRYHRGENPRVWAAETGFVDSVYSHDGKHVPDGSPLTGLRSMSPRTLKLVWGQYKDQWRGPASTMPHFMQLVHNNNAGSTDLERSVLQTSDTSLVTFSPRILSMRDQHKKDQRVEPFEYKKPITQAEKDLRNHKFWYVTLDYKDKPTSVHGYWHWNTSFLPCTQLTDFPRREGSPMSPRPGEDPSRNISQLSSPALSPRTPPRRRSRSPSPREEGDRDESPVIRSLTRMAHNIRGTLPKRKLQPWPSRTTKKKSTRMSGLSSQELSMSVSYPADLSRAADGQLVGDHFQQFAHEKRKQLSSLAHSKVLFVGDKRMGISSSGAFYQGSPRTEGDVSVMSKSTSRRSLVTYKSERHARVAESINRLAPMTQTSYNTRKRAPARKYRQFLYTSLHGTKKDLPIIADRVDALNPTRREGSWWQEPKPSDKGWRSNTRVTHRRRCGEGGALWRQPDRLTDLIYLSSPVLNACPFSLRFCYIFFTFTFGYLIQLEVEPAWSSYLVLVRSNSASLLFDPD